MVSASIEDGAQIKADESITLVFSKNVCEASVRETNMSLVSVKDAQDAKVPITVVLADDQVEPNKKNDMTITFDQPLKEGAYTLTAQAGITAKSGDVLAEDYVLHFSVAAQGSSSASASSSSASAASASASASSASASAASASSASEASASSSESSSASESSSSSSASSSNQRELPGVVIPIAIGIVVVVVIAGIVAWVKKKK